MQATLEFIRLDYYPNNFEMAGPNMKPKSRLVQDSLFELGDKKGTFPPFMQKKNYVVRPSVTIVERNKSKLVIYSWWNIIRVR